MFEKYDAYKDSGIQWIGRIPEHWEIEKAKWIFLKADRPIRPNDGIVTCFRDGEVTLRSNRRTDGFTNALKEHGYQGIRKGDLVIHAMDAFAGAIGVSDSDGKSTPVYSACIPRIKNRINVHYYAYYLRNLALAGFIESLAKGIRERSTDFRFADFAELLLPFPKLEDQERIVAFLNQKTAEIDQAIAIKEQQIALLNERKQIVIQKAVTQGLDPNVPMKDSGVEWIGQIPEHWECKPSRYAFRAVKRFKRDGTEIKFSVTQKWGVIPTDEMQESATQAVSFDGFQICLEDDLVLNKYKAHLGVFWRAPSRGLITGNYTVFEPLKGINSKYFELLYHTPVYIDIFRTIVYGVIEGMMPLYNNDFYDMLSIVPPLEEQLAIVQYVGEQQKEFSKIERVFLGQIEKLKEYKTTLINDAVTGKIKVA